MWIGNLKKNTTLKQAFRSHSEPYKPLCIIPICVCESMHNLTVFVTDCLDNHTNQESGWIWNYYIFISYYDLP